ncbi:MAG: hypothetical protein VYE18_07565, partial [Pseudomonadota bacterium]|nr:hypothetical protein [Pseudomonadota bacterium]
GTAGIGDSLHLALKEFVSDPSPTEGMFVRHTTYQAGWPHTGSGNGCWTVRAPSAMDQKT